jgi:hypothetical protein
LSQGQKYCLFATEGPHDQAAISKLLQLSGFIKFDGVAKNLDPFWEAFVPKYPKAGKLYTRMDMPTILTSQTHSVAVYWGEGSNLIQNLIAIATAHSPYTQEIHAFGLFIDADNKQPEVIAKNKSEALRGIFPMLSEMPGNISGENPKTGIYIFPDNKRTGALDTILVDCASTIYPDHKNGAIDFLNSLDIKHTKHLNAINKDKATVACIVSVLKPGMANTASIAQDEWISEKTANNSYLLLLDQFLKELLK